MKDKDVAMERLRQKLAADLMLGLGLGILGQGLAVQGRVLGLGFRGLAWKNCESEHLMMFPCEPSKHHTGPCILSPHPWAPNHAFVRV